MKPLVSVIMPVWNERRCIDRTIESLLRQNVLAFDLEFIIVDGGSDDGSAEILQAYAQSYPNFRVLHNPHRKTPFAFNLGLAAARGEYVAILGAHAEYPDNYIATCYAELLAHNATGCSGRIVTAPDNETLSARLVAASIAHPFASSSNSVRTQNAGFADTVAFPVFRKSALIEAGGYDVCLHRNQDNDMNQRLRAAGHLLYVTDKVAAVYRARPSVRSLISYAFTTGRWNALTLRYKRHALSLRHFMPLLYVSASGVLALATLIAATMGRAPRVPGVCLALLMCAHLVAGSVVAIAAALSSEDTSLLLMPLVILAFHLAYGAGTAFGLLWPRLITSGTPAALTGGIPVLENGNSSTSR